MDALIQDIRYAWRKLRKSPGFSIVVVLTLALGIGANTAIYSLLDQALLRSLPVKDPDRLVSLKFSGVSEGSTWAHGELEKNMVFSYPTYQSLRDHNSVFSGLIATRWAKVGLQWHNQPDLGEAELVSGNYFDVLGVQPAIGRLFVSADDVTKNANPVVVLSFEYWQRKFGLDPHIVNQSVLINGHPFTILGVVRPGFRSVIVGNTPEIFAPMTMKPEIVPGIDDLDDHFSQSLSILGRLKPGLSREQAEAGIAPLWYSIRNDEFNLLGHNLSAQFRDAFLTNSHLFLLDSAKGVAGNDHTPLLIIGGMTGLMLLMACANVGSLLLVRIGGRIREVSVRYALGAKRRRVVQLVLAEAVLLGTLGGTLGLVLAPQISALLLRMMFVQSDGVIPFSTHLDWRSFTFNFALAIFVSLIFSLAPVLQFRRPDFTPALKQQVSTVPRGSMRFRRIAVAVQIALSLLLLFAAGLFVRTLRNLETLDVGFATDHLVKFAINPVLSGYKTDQANGLYSQILDKLSGLPGVRSAAATSDPELSNTNWRRNITISGINNSTIEDKDVEWELVSANYCRTLEMPLIAGRDFSEEDINTKRGVAVVSENLATHYFGTPQNAVGRFLGPGAGNVKTDIEIIGVIQDAKHTTMRGDIRRMVLVPYSPVSWPNGMTFYVRTWQSPVSAEATIRQAMLQYDSKLVLDGFRTMREQINNSLSDERMIAFLASVFGLLGASLAAIGIYGVLAYSTAQRTREIGIRIALGATRGTVLRMILTEVLWLAGIGVVVGLPVSLLLIRTIRSQLFGISSDDPLTLCLVVIAISALAFVSATLPARRAAKVDPMVALRYE